MSSLAQKGCLSLENLDKILLATGKAQRVGCWWGPERVVVASASQIPVWTCIPSLPLLSLKQEHTVLGRVQAHSLEKGAGCVGGSPAHTQLRLALPHSVCSQEPTATEPTSVMESLARPRDSREERCAAGSMGR